MHCKTWACVKPDGDGCDGKHCAEEITRLTDELRKSEGQARHFERQWRATQEMRERMITQAAAALLKKDCELSKQAHEIITLRNALESILSHQCKKHAQGKCPSFDERIYWSVAREALTLIAAPKRADGTYNRCREACEDIARKALEGKDG